MTEEGIKIDQMVKEGAVVLPEECLKNLMTGPLYRRKYTNFTPIDTKVMMMRSLLNLQQTRSAQMTL